MFESALLSFLVITSAMDFNWGASLPILVLGTKYSP
jgi:hypothetical protein